MDLYGHLADELDSTERLEGDGSTVLDNSVLLHTSDMATGLHTFKAGVGAWNRREGGQYSRGMPYCIAGSAGGALRTNQHFVLDDESYTMRTVSSCSRWRARWASLRRHCPSLASLSSASARWMSC